MEVIQDNPDELEIPIPPVPSVPPQEPNMQTPEVNVDEPENIPDTGGTAAATVSPKLPEKTYPRRNRAPVIRFEPTW